MADTEHWFSKIATNTAIGSGRPLAFGIAGGFVAGWLLTGPLFHFSDTWQLVMNYCHLLDGVLNTECAKSRKYGTSAEPR